MIYDSIIILYFLQRRETSSFTKNHREKSKKKKKILFGVRKELGKLQNFLKYLGKAWQVCSYVSAC